MPSKYESKFAREIVELSKMGRSLVQIASEFGVSERTMRQWKNEADKLEFRDAYQLAKEAFEAYHEDILQKMAKGIIKGGNAQAQMYILNNRCRDKWGTISTQKIDMTTEAKKLTDKDIEDRLKEIMAIKAQRNNPPSSGTPANPQLP